MAQYLSYGSAFPVLEFVYANTQILLSDLNSLETYHFVFIYSLTFYFMFSVYKSRANFIYVSLC